MYLSHDLATLISSLLLLFHELQIQQKQVVVAPSQKPAFTTNHRVTKENRSEALETQQPDESGDGVGDEVVPVEVRPGQNQDCACSQVVESKSLVSLLVLCVLLFGCAIKLQVLIRWILGGMRHGFTL